MIYNWVWWTWSEFYGVWLVVSTERTLHLLQISKHSTLLYQSHLFIFSFNIILILCIISYCISSSILGEWSHEYLTDPTHPLYCTNFKEDILTDITLTGVTLVHCNDLLWTYNCFYMYAVRERRHRTGLLYLYFMKLENTITFPIFSLYQNHHRLNTCIILVLCWYVRAFSLHNVPASWPITSNTLYLCLHYLIQWTGQNGLHLLTFSFYKTLRFSYCHVDTNLSILHYVK